MMAHHKPNEKTMGIKIVLFVAYAWIFPIAAFPQSVTNDFLSAHLDSLVDPRKDFFDYANGGWLARNPIPDSEPSWGIGNLVTEEHLQFKIQTIFIPTPGHIL